MRGSLRRPVREVLSSHPNLSISARRPPCVLPVEGSFETIVALGFLGPIAARTDAARLPLGYDDGRAVIRE